MPPHSWRSSRSLPAHGWQRASPRKHFELPPFAGSTWPLLWRLCEADGWETGATASLALFSHISFEVSWVLNAVWNEKRLTFEEFLWPSNSVRDCKARGLMKPVGSFHSASIRFALFICVYIWVATPVSPSAWFCGIL